MTDDVRWQLLGLSGWVFLALAGVLAALQPGRRALVQPARLWSAGLVLLGVGALLLSLRGRLPVWASFTLANTLSLAGLMLRGAALRNWAGLPMRGWLLGLLLGLFAATFHALLVLGHPNARGLTAQLSLLLVFADVARQAWRLQRVQQTVAGLAMTAAEALCALLLLGVLVLRAAWGVPVVDAPTVWPLVVITTVTTVGAIVSTGAFVGCQFELLRRSERAAHDAEQRALGRGEAAEQHGRELQRLADVQRTLATERARLLGLISHEVRQPLHNASGVLQALRLAMQRPQPPQMGELVTRVARADQVLGQVRDVLDNVLVAGLLLEDDRPLAVLQAVDLRMALDLALMDLPDVQRERVSVQLHSRHEAIRAEPNLLRLALRNLLRNACEHGGAAARVTLQARDEADGALVLAVRDDGPGYPAAVLAAFAASPTQGPLQLAPDGLGRGLGLQVVARVAQRHGARLQLRNLGAQTGSAGGAEALLCWSAGSQAG